MKKSNYKLQLLGDIEAEGYLELFDDQDVQWCFISEFSSEIAIQFLMTIATAVIAAGSACYVVLIFMPFTAASALVESPTLTTVVVAILTRGTFWARRRGCDFNFLGPFLLDAVLVVMLIELQISLLLNRISYMIYGCSGSVIFCGCIVYYTDHLIKRSSYGKCIWDAVSLYVGIVNLFDHC